MKTVIIKLQEPVVTATTPIGSITADIKNISNYNILSGLLRLSKHPDTTEIYISNSIQLYKSSENKYGLNQVIDSEIVTTNNIEVNDYFLLLENGKQSDKPFLYIRFKNSETSGSIIFNDFIKYEQIGINWGNMLVPFSFYSSDIVFYNAHNLKSICTWEIKADSNITGAYNDFCVNALTNLNDYNIDISIVKHCMIKNVSPQKALVTFNYNSSYTDILLLQFDNNFETIPKLKVNYDKPNSMKYALYSENYIFDSVEDVNKFVTNCKKFDNQNECCNHNIYIKPIPTVDTTDFINSFEQYYNGKYTITFSNHEE